ncbi:MAG TPA: polysaccharide biosynthesis/export family protein [Blastocatellia bacterium]|nr:polysaccharide biosynthesis/export family protein [Blastocatellia bacterium]
MVSPDEDYKIGPRDVIDVQVEKAPELSGTWNVSASGTFLMPYVGRVVAVNKTTEELAALIADRLRGDYLKSPRVKVSVKQYNSRSFFIQGAVRSPGVYQIEGRASLLKLIILAGGLSDNHGSSAFIIREIKAGGGGETAENNDADAAHARRAGGAVKTVSDGEPKVSGADASDASAEKYELIMVNINGLLKGHFDQNMIVEPGDIINVPPSDLFFVAGEVRAPGSYTLKEGTTLRQAISLAQGTTFNAAASHGIIFREEPGTGKRLDMKVDIGGVMSGKKPDVPIMANDVVIVPNSRMKSVTHMMLSAFGVQAVIRGLPY